MTDRTRELTELELEELELETELRARRADLAEGLVPEGVVRSLYEHELLSRANFAAIEAELDTAAATIESRLVQDRGTFLELLEADLSEQTDAVAVLKRISAIDGPAGIVSVAGAKELVANATRFHAGVLYELALTGANRVRQEAAAQGETVPKTPIKLAPETRAALDAQALRLAQGPLVDVVRAIRERAYVEAAR